MNKLDSALARPYTYFRSRLVAVASSHFLVSSSQASQE